MKKFLPFVILPKSLILAAIPAVVILVGHWLRTSELNLQDLLTAAFVFTTFLFFASWVERRKAQKL